MLVCEAMHLLLKKLFVTKETKEVTLNWVATILQLNDARVGLNFADSLAYEMNMMLSTDGMYV